MTEPDYTLAAYVEDLKRITAEENDEKAIFKRLAPLAQNLAATPGWVTDTYRQCDEEQGFGVHVLHEEDDHANAVFVVSWLPNRGTPLHDSRHLGRRRQHRGQGKRDHVAAQRRWRQTRLRRS